MAKVDLGYGITSISGRFAGGRYRRGSTILTAEPAKPAPKKEGDTCPCKAWKYADHLWAQLIIETEPWRTALKRPHMSAYDLWMREAVKLGAHGHYYPDTPSISGGWSTSKVTPGQNYQPPACCVPDYLETWIYKHLYTTPTKTHVVVDILANDPRTPPIGIALVTVKLYGLGIDHEPTWTPEPGPSPYHASEYLPIDFTPLWYIRITALDGTASDHYYDELVPIYDPGRRVDPQDPWLCLGDWPTRCYGGKESISSD